MRVGQIDIKVDDVLRQEIVSPGSDHRMGINFVARPSMALKAFITSRYDRLKALEPDQYYYPLEDLHLTVVEMCSGQTLEETTTYTRRLMDGIDAILANLPEIILEDGRLMFDQKAAIIKFRSPNETLEMVRDEIRSRLNKAGLGVKPRYLSDSAHITILRYTRSLESSIDLWETRLRDLSHDLFKSWQIDKVWLTTGATWYARRASIEQYGPFELSCK